MLNMPGPYLVATDVTQTYGDRVVFSKASFACAPGEVVALLGNNGAGKSTFLKILAGLAQPTEGKVSLGGLRATALVSEARVQAVAYQAQQLPRVEGFAVADFVALAQANRRYLARRHVPLPEESAWFQACLRTFDAAQLSARSLETLSGGEWMRVQLARVWAQRARINLLDEPDTGLDLRHVSLLVQEIRKCVRGSEASVPSAFVLTTHNLSFALAVATRVCILGPQGFIVDSPVEALAASKNLEELYGVPLAWTHIAGEPRPRVVPLI